MCSFLFLFFSPFVLSEALEKVFCRENNFHLQQRELFSILFLFCTTEGSHLNTHALENQMRRKYRGFFFFLRPEEPKQFSGIERQLLLLHTDIFLYTGIRSVAAKSTRLSVCIWE